MINNFKKTELKPVAQYFLEAKYQSLFFFFEDYLGLSTRAKHGDCSEF